MCPGKAGGATIWFQIVVEIFGVRERGPGLGMQPYVDISPSPEAEQGSLQLGGWGSSVGVRAGGTCQVGWATFG